MLRQRNGRAATVVPTMVDPGSSAGMMIWMNAVIPAGAERRAGIYHSPRTRRSATAMPIGRVEEDTALTMNPNETLTANAV